MKKIVLRETTYLLHRMVADCTFITYMYGGTPTMDAPPFFRDEI